MNTGLFVGEIIQQAQNICGPTDAAARQKFIESMGTALQYLQRNGRWLFQRKLDYIVTVIPYAAGTVTVTQGSRAVVGAGTVWTGMADRVFIGPDNNRYVISAIGSPTALTLSTPYAGSSGALGAYQIVQDRYSFPAGMQELLDIRLQYPYYTLNFIDREMFDRKFPRPYVVSFPRFFTDAEPLELDYTTGAVAGTLDTYALVGTATAWLSSNLGKFSKLVVLTGNIPVYAYFTVKEVVDDTNIKVFEAVPVAFTGRSYVGKVWRKRFQFYPIPADVYSMPFYYTEYCPLPKQESDILNVDGEFHTFFLQYIVWDFFRRNNDPRAVTYERDWMKIIEDMHAKFLSRPFEHDVQQMARVGSVSPYADTVVTGVRV